MKILLVEDNPGDARLIEEMIKEVEDTAKFDLVHVKSLAEAIHSLGTDSFDSVLLDLGLPDSSGLDTLVRVHEEAPDMPIVILTGLADEVVSSEALRRGAQDYLVKGRVDSNVLIRAMRYATQSKGGGRQK